MEARLLRYLSDANDANEGRRNELLHWVSISIYLGSQFLEALLGRRRVVLFIDSCPALDSLVKGDFSLRLWRELRLVRENPEERLPMFLWVARVPSRSNVADPPSRGSVRELATWELAVEHHVCPLCNRTLRSLL